MTATEIANNIINGNRSDAREGLRKAKGKIVVLDVLEELAEYRGGYQSGIADLRSLLGARR